MNLYLIEKEQLVKKLIILKKKACKRESNKSIYKRFNNKTPPARAMFIESIT